MEWKVPFFTFTGKLLVKIEDCSRNCSGQFQVATAGENDKASDRGGENNVRTSDVWNSEEHDGRHSEEYSDKIISPGSYVPRIFTLCKLTNAKLITQANSRKQDNRHATTLKY
jgi:hypothetical protein